MFYTFITCCRGCCCCGWRNWVWDSRREGGVQCGWKLSHFLVKLWRPRCFICLYVFRNPGVPNIRFLSSSQCVIAAQKRFVSRNISAVCPQRRVSSFFSPVTLLTEPLASVAYHVKESQALFFFFFLSMCEKCLICAFLSSFTSTFYANYMSIYSAAAGEHFSNSPFRL